MFTTNLQRARHVTAALWVGRSCDDVGCCCRCSHQEEAGAVGDELDLGVAGEREDGHSVLSIDGHDSTQEATQTHTQTHTQ